MTDRELAVQAFRRARSLFPTKRMQPILVGPEYRPGANVTRDEGVLDYIMESSYRNWHTWCTCRMGKVNDSLAVVDTHAKVIGIHGLRTVKAFSIALPPPGHPQSTVCEFACLIKYAESEIYANIPCANVLAEMIAVDILSGH